MIEPVEMFRSFLSSFYQLNDSEWEQVAPLIKLSSLKKDEFFTQTGSPATKVGFVIQGLFKIYMIGEDGKVFIRNFSKENDFIFPYSDAIETKKSSFDIQAIEDSKILVFPYPNNLPFYQESRCWCELSRIMAEQCFIKRQKRELDFLSQTAALRYQKFKESFPELISRVENRDLASYLGITPETLSRLKTKSV